MEAQGEGQQARGRKPCRRAERAQRVLEAQAAGFRHGGRDPQPAQGCGSGAGTAVGFGGVDWGDVGWSSRRTSSSLSFLPDK